MFESPGAFYRCAPLLHGFRNEIWLDAYEGQTGFSFIVKFEGLTPLSSTGYSIPLADETGKIVTYIVMEDITDANGAYSDKNLIDIADYGDGSYLVTITLDQGFLEDPGTQFPVMAAASVQLTASYIDDTLIKSGLPNNNYYSVATQSIGYEDSIAKVCRNYFQFVFPLNSSNYFQGIKPVGVTGATFYVYEKSGYTSSRTLQTRFPSNIWSPGSITWNNAPTPYSSGTTSLGVSDPPDVTMSSSPAWYGINVRYAVTAMLRNYISTSLAETIHEKRGLCLKLSNEASGNLKQIYSSNNSSYKPYVTVSYVDASSRSFASQNSVTGGSTAPPNVSNCWGYAMWKSATYQPALTASNHNGIRDDIKNRTEVQVRNTYPNAVVRHLSGRDAAINSGEYRIAYRYNGGEDPDGYIQVYAGDYHFLVQLDSGAWAGKFGNPIEDTNPKNHGMINPGTTTVSAVWGSSGLFTGMTTYYLGVDIDG